MAMKRKLMAAPLKMSLYGDLDVGSTATLERPDSTANAAADSDSDCSTKKKPREENSTVPESGTGEEEEEEDDGAVGELISVCGWRKGERQDMQDAHVRQDQFGLNISNIRRSAFYAIFDGHAGRRAADFAAEHLPSRLKKKVDACTDVASLEKGIKKCFVDTYKQIDEQFLIEARRTRPSWKDGTTATTILLVNNVIYCANIGDSKMRQIDNSMNFWRDAHYRRVVVVLYCYRRPNPCATNYNEFYFNSKTFRRYTSTSVGKSLAQTWAIVCRSKSEDDDDVKVVAMQLTVDHSPLHFEERMRIQKAGGNVKDGRIMGILEVSRSIGDGQFKTYGLICTPDVKKFSITQDDRFVLIACDGLWKTFSNQEAIDFVMTKIRQPRKQVEEKEPETREMIWQSVADELAAESVKRGCGDNVSVIIVVLHDVERNSASK